MSNFTAYGSNGTEGKWHAATIPIPSYRIAFSESVYWHVTCIVLAWEVPPTIVIQRLGARTTQLSVTFSKYTVDDAQHVQPSTTVPVNINVTRLIGVVTTKGLGSVQSQPQPTVYKTDCLRPPFSHLPHTMSEETLHKQKFQVDQWPTSKVTLYPTRASIVRWASHIVFQMSTPKAAPYLDRLKASSSR